MCQQWLDYLMLPFIEQHLATEITSDAIMDEFKVLNDVTRCRINDSMDVEGRYKNRN